MYIWYYLIGAAVKVDSQQRGLLVAWAHEMVVYYKLRRPSLLVKRRPSKVFPRFFMLYITTIASIIEYTDMGDE